MHPTGRYHPLSIGAHWLTLLLLAAVYALMELRGIFPKGSVAHDAMKTWHFMLGFAVFGLAFARLALRGLFRAPAGEEWVPAWQRFLARAMHVSLYAFLIVTPLLGWLALSARGRPIPFFGLDLPALLAPSRALARNFKDVHEAIGILGYCLVGLHAAAALLHHYALRDDLLRRMWPRRAKTRPASELHKPQGLRTLTPHSS